MAQIREKRHRLPAKCYRGQVKAAFTINTAPPCSPFFADAEFVSVAVDALSEAFTNNGGHVAVIVFMPDHAHLIVSGAHRDSDLLAMVKEFKQKTTFRARKTLPSFAWQKDFYDHIIRDETDYANQVRYILRNPVRAGLCDRWQDWPHRFVLGQTWEDLALNIATH